jgi:hypothetical protein
MIGNRRGARRGAIVAALTLAAVVAGSPPASAAIKTGWIDCGAFRSAKIVAKTGPGTTKILWGELGGPLNHSRPYTTTGVKTVYTGMSYITWYVESQFIDSAYGTCYYA